MLSISGEVKLIDFGLCADVSDGEKTSMVGSPFWLAPEMIQRQPYGVKVDVWSLGVCLMELANGKPPHSRSGFRAMFTAGTVGYPEPLEGTREWGNLFREFMVLCLTMNPDKRPHASELLKHNFLEKTDTAESMQQILSNIFVLQSVLPF
jgi:serine/threonine protein kinase